MIGEIAIKAVWDLLPVVCGGLLGYLFWWFQTKTTNRLALVKDKAAEEVREKLSEEQEAKLKLESERAAMQIRLSIMEKAIADNIEKLAVMNQTVTPMYEAMKLKMIQILTHPHPEFKIPDDLLEKVSSPDTVGRIEPQEMIQLEELLKERAQDPNPEITEVERLAARALPIMIKLAAVEKAATDAITEVQLVSSTIVAEVAKK